MYSMHTRVHVHTHSRDLARNEYEYNGLGMCLAAIKRSNYLSANFSCPSTGFMAALNFSGPYCTQIGILTEALQFLF